MASWAASLAAIALITAGCADALESGSGTELVWAAGWTTPPAVAIAGRWNELHPDGPKVRIARLPESADDQHRLLALELNAGLNNFDILELDVIWTAEFAQNGWLVDLEKLHADIERGSLSVAVQTAVWDGRLWAAPYTTDAGLLYYRSDLMEKPPTTWEELRDVGFRIGTEQGIAPFVADGAQHEGMAVQYLEYFWSAGGEVLDADGRSVLFQSGPALRAAEFMNDAYREGFYAPGFNTMKLEDARDAFQSGQAVFMRSWPYAYRQMNGPGPDPDSQVVGKVGIAPLPTFAGSGPAAALGGHNLAVSRFSDNVSAATEFVRFASTSPEVQRELAEQHSMAPTLKVVYDDLSGDPLVELLATVLPTARLRPAMPEWTTISEEMQQKIFAAYTGDPDPGPEIDALRDFLDATVKDR
ncbi:MAG: ABC transporter substrate-binding protein [Pseudonocardiaceae bacterium]